MDSKLLLELSLSFNLNLISILWFWVWYWSTFSLSLNLNLELVTNLHLTSIRLCNWVWTSICIWIWNWIWTWIWIWSQVWDYTSFSIEFWFEIKVWIWIFIQTLDLDLSLKANITHYLSLMSQCDMTVSHKKRKSSRQWMRHEAKADMLCSVLLSDRSVSRIQRTVRTSYMWQYESDGTRNQADMQNASYKLMKMSHWNLQVHVPITQSSLCCCTESVIFFGKAHARLGLTLRFAPITYEPQIASCTCRCTWRGKTELLGGTLEVASMEGRAGLLHSYLLSL